MARGRDGAAVEDAFDPGAETGYLRRAPREHELDVELGAAPFEPGPGAGYDTRRAKRAQRRHEKAEKRLQQQRERAEQEGAERERAEALRALRERERNETERAERERERLARAQELHEQNLRAQEEQLERRRQERARLQAERKRVAEERRAQERAERDRMLQERKERARELKAKERVRHAQREGREREEALREKRERSLREERERAQRMHARRRQLVAAASESAEQEPGERPEPQVVSAPAATKAPPPDVRPIPKQSLKRPTLKAGLALALITATAAGAGTLLGLPLPSIGSDPGDSTPSSLAGDTLLLGGGTPASLTKGPFQPVAGPTDFGQKDAKFGAPRSGHMHEGQDMFAKKGTPLVAVRDGIVVDRGKVNGRYSGGRGNYLAIYSPLDDRSFVYMHLLEPAPVLVGQEVKAGQEVGRMGCTGTCFGTHLHFEIRIGEARLRAKTKAIDPLPYLREWPRAPAAAAPDATAPVK